MSQDEALAGRVNRSIFFAGLAAAALVLFAGLGWAVYDGFMRTDPGIAACESIRDGRDITSGTDDEPGLSEDEYRSARAQFERSDHKRIGEHGTQLMDVVWNLSRVPDNQGAAAIGYVGPLTAQPRGYRARAPTRASSSTSTAASVADPFGVG